MEKKKDLRIQKTYIALTNAFMNLLRKKKFEDISVQEICDLAMVGRATFYKHFADKYEFTVFCVHRMHQTYVDEAEDYATDNPSNYYTKLIQRIFDFIDTNADLIHALESSSVFPLLLDSCSDNLTHNLQIHLEKDWPSDKPMPVSPEILAQLFMGGVMQCSKWWYIHQDAMSKEEMLRTLFSLLGRI